MHPSGMGPFHTPGELQLPKHLVQIFFSLSSKLELPVITVEQRHDAIQDRSPIAGHGMEASNERALRLESS